MTARYLPKPTDKSDVSLLIYELFTLLFNNDSNWEDKKTTLFEIPKLDAN